MERVNAPTKDIVYTTTRKMVEPLEIESHDVLWSICRITEKQSQALTSLWYLYEKLKERLTNFKPGIKDKEIWLGNLIRTLN